MKGISEIMSKSGSEADSKIPKKYAFVSVKSPNSEPKSTLVTSRPPEQADENGHEASPIDVVHKADFSKLGMQNAQKILDESHQIGNKKDEPKKTALATIKAPVSEASVDK